MPDTNVAATTSAANLPVTIDNNSGQLVAGSVFSSSDAFDLGQRMARALASSDLVPTQYRNNLANCLIALDIALARKVSPLMIMQNMTIIQGRPAWSAQYIIAAINSCGLFSPLRYDWRGIEFEDSWGCRATATDRSSNEVLTGTWVTIAMAKAEGWHGRNGSKWLTMPEQMLRYRAGAFFGRIYAPQITLGFPTIEEVVDTTDPRGTLADLLRSGTRTAADAQGVSPVTPVPAAEPAPPRRRGRPARVVDAEPAAPAAETPAPDAPAAADAPPVSLPDVPADTVVNTDPF